jgi:hypothetical protein
MRARTVLAAAMALAAACGRGHELPSVLPQGTWGGRDAGLVVTAQGVHVHLGCTIGDIAGRVAIGPGGSFEASGQHNVDAFPVDLGILHPARYSGRLHGDDRLTIEAVLLDTGRRLGPLEAFLGREPQLECPICAVRPRE